MKHWPLRPVVLAFAIPGLILACSGLTVVKNGRVALGVNSDQAFVDNMQLRVTPGKDGLFGRMCVARVVVPGWSPMGATCINDRGLAISHANTPPADYPHDPDKPQFRHNLFETIVAEAATVKQALAMVHTYTWPPDHKAGMHMMLVDPSGDTAVVEWVQGEVKVIRREGPALLMTNSLLSRPETVGGGPNSRYNRASRMLPQLRDASAASVFSVLREISVGAVLKGKEVGTLFSVVWDVRDGELHLVYKRDFDHSRKFNLSEELAKGEHSYDLATLFPNPIPFETAWRDDNGPVVRKAVK